MRRNLRIAGAALAMAAQPAMAQGDASPAPAVDLAGEVIVDVAGLVSGAGDRKLRALSNVNLTADLDLARLAGWSGMRAHVHLLDNRGGRPNDAVATLQGWTTSKCPTPACACSRRGWSGTSALAVRRCGWAFMM
jgi:porin